MTEQVPLHLRAAEAYVRARDALRPHEAAHADQRLTGWLDRFESHMADTVGPLLEEYANDPEVPPEVRDLFAQVLHPSEALGVSPLIAIVAGLFYPLVSAAMAGPQALVAAHSFGAMVGAGGTVPLSPAEVALGQVRNTLGKLDPYSEGARSGYDPERVDILALNTGEPIGVAEGLLLFRRGKLTLDQLRHLVRQSRIRDEWFDSVVDLQYTPPGVGEVIAGALKGHLSDTDATQKVAEAGVDPVNFPWMRATAGRPPGIEQMLALRNRNQATTDDVTAAVRQSDINDHYLPFVLHLGEYHPPVRSIMAMLRSGAIDDTKATTLFQNQGVLAADIPGYLAEAHHGRTSSAKTLGQSTVIRMYLAGLLSHADATSRLVALGYQPADTDLLLQMADDAKKERYANAIITRMHTLYVSHKATDTDVHSALAADGIDTTLTSELLALWKIERSANVHAPTVPMIGHAYRQGYITATETKTRLLAAGVQPDDLGIVVANFYPPSIPHAELLKDVNAVLTA